jgi:hypothetical protein
MTKLNNQDQESTGKAWMLQTGEMENQNMDSTDITCTAIVSNQETKKNETCVVIMLWDSVSKGFHPAQRSLCMDNLMKKRKEFGNENLLMDFIYLYDPEGRAHYEVPEVRIWWREILTYDPSFYKYLSESTKQNCKLSCSITPPDVDDDGMWITNPCHAWINAFRTDDSIEHLSKAMYL